MNILEAYKKITKHLLNDEKPSDYLNTISEESIFREKPFDMLFELKKTEQSPQYHPEGNVWNHTMLVVDVAAKEKNKSRNAHIFMWAALLHDIGKPSTTRNKKGKITSYNHDRVGEKLAKEFLSYFTFDTDFINEVTTLIRFHMQLLYVVKDLHFADINNMKLMTDINEVALLGFCDRMGRLHADYTKEKNNIELFLNKCYQTIKT